MMVITHWSCIFPNESINPNNSDKFKRVRLLSVGLSDVLDRIDAFLPPVCLRTNLDFSWPIGVDRFVQGRPVFPPTVFPNLTLHLLNRDDFGARDIYHRCKSHANTWLLVLDIIDLFGSYMSLMYKSTDHFRCNNGLMTWFWRRKLQNTLVRK
jgi:hypothetical protein